VQVGAAAARDLQRVEEVGRLEAGGADQHVRRMGLAIGRVDRVFRQVRDALRDQFDVGALEHLRPGAVVAQHALGTGRVVGRDLGQQVGPVRELALQRVEAFAPQRFVGGAHRDRVLPGRIDLHQVQPAFDADPDLPEPEPAAVGGQVPQQPLHARLQIVVVGWRGQHPRGVALEDAQLPHLVVDLGADLEGAGPGADQRHPAACERHIGVPGCRVDDGALEGLEPREGRDAGAVEQPHRGDDEVEILFPDLPRLVAP